MERTFKEVPSFTAKWQALGLNDDDLRTLENILLKDPKIGDVIRGTGGLRKVRIPMEYAGKRGGGRVIYIDIEVKECIYLLNVYAKNEQIDLTDKEKDVEKVGFSIKGGVIMSFYEEMERSLLEAIEIEKGNIPLVQKEDILAPTFTASDTEKKLIDEMIKLRKQQNISQHKLAEITGNRQQAISRMENKEHSPSLKLFYSIVRALGYDLKIVKRNV